MSARAASRAAWTLFGVYAALALGTVASIILADGRSDDAFVLLAAGYAVVGALIASRRPGNPIGWLLLAVAIALTLGAFGEAYVATASNPARPLVGWLASWTWYVWLILAAVFVPLLFPDGKLLTRRWRGVLWLGAAALAVSVVAEALRPGALDIDTADIDNPLGLSAAAADAVTVAATGGNVLAATAFVLAGVSLVLRFRRSRGVERQQLKWFALAGLLALTGLVLAMAAVLSGGENAGEQTGSWYALGAVGWFTALFSIIVGIPAATGLAMLRHRLYDVDVVINRTLVYGALTATLLAAYLGGVLLLQLTLSPLTEESDLSIAGSTLAVAALFRPARRRIQEVVDRRFYRRRYDAAQTLNAFSGRLREEVDLDALGTELGAVVRETMQPAHVSLWLREPSEAAR